MMAPLFDKDDCTDAGGRATQGAVAEGLGEIFLNKSPSIPLYSKGEEIPLIPLFQKGKLFVAIS
jgi:hypothetical protein